jgi:hypothetical protein
MIIQQIFKDKYLQKFKKSVFTFKKKLKHKQ